MAFAAPGAAIRSAPVDPLVRVATYPKSGGTVLPWAVSVLPPVVAPGKDVPMYTK
ncbi:hypothetical protein Slala05_67400 [Streptomyces lavendulae subsp. lavendulae]|nr:hypothetical protein Slala05_67400 [Streptomyces lavendulae subsp. lavendulae]